MDDDETDVLTQMTFPTAHRLQIQSTNPLERLNAEVKRRTGVVGIFPNEAAITRLVGGPLLEQKDEWQLQRRHGLRTLRRRGISVFVLKSQVAVQHTGI